LRYFLGCRVPPVSRILLVESGSRSIIERVLPAVRSMFGSGVETDLVTCYQGQPEGFAGRVFRIDDYGGAAGRRALFSDLAARRYAAAGILCAAEPIMTKWKWWLAWRLPAKIFVINENADFFWLDRCRWRTVLHFALYRAGLTGSGAIPALARLVFFPVTLVYLLLYAAAVHLRRRMRML
jgi:hypothetical protein